MLRCAQHDRMGTANLTLWSLSFARRGMFWRKPKQGEVARSSEHFFVIPSIFFCHSKCSFLSFRAPARNPVWMLRCAQHDRMGTANLTLWSLSFARRGMFWRKPKQGEVARSSEHFFVIPSIFFCHSKCSFLSFRAPARNPVWMLRCAQHDRMGTAKLTLWSLSFARRGMFWRKPKQGEVARSSEHFFVIPSIFFCHSKCSFLSFRTPVRNPVWMLRCAQHDRMGTAKLTLWSLSFARRGMFWRKPKQGEVARSSEHFFVIPSIFFCHSKCSFLSFRAPVRNPQHGCFAALSMTGWGQQTSPSGPSPSQGEGCFGESQNRVRSHGLPSTFLSFQAFSFVIPSALFCHSERSEESTAWMLRCAQHDRMGTAKLTLLSLSLQKERDVLAKAKTG
jgi:hypothetical protein